MIKKIIQFVLQHKVMAGVLILAIIGGGYYGSKSIFSNDNVVRYATAQVQRGTLITSISGSGQVSASNQADIKPKVSGDVVYVGVKNGQEVKAGTLLVQIDSSDAQKAVRDAEISLETAKLELDKLLEPVDELDLLKAENSLAKAKETKQKAEDNITKSYEDAFNTIATAFLDLPTLITGLHDILYSYELGYESGDRYNWNITVLTNSINYGSERNELEKFINSAETAYKTARTKYDANFENYKNVSRYSDKEVIEALLNETLETTKAMAETVKNETNMLDFWVDYRSRRDLRIYDKVTEYQSDIKSYTSKINSHLISLLNIQRSLQDNRESILNAQRSIEELELSLAKLKAGPDELDIRAKKIAIQQKEDALLDAQQSLADHYVRAPFDGIIANLNVKKGESVSSNNAVATLITKQKIAEITLNEVDIAQVKTGQKVNITFDAIENLNITGKVVETDTLGTVSQGVVTYGVKIAFDTQDERVKPGMTLSANIITEVKQDVLMVPSSAIKQQGDISYVQVVANDADIETNLAATNTSGAIIPQSSLRVRQIQVGLSNDTMTEVISGLKEGDIVITQTINSKTTLNQSQRSTGGTALPRGGMMFIR